MVYGHMLNYQKIKDEHIRVSQELSREDIAADRLKYQALAKRFAFLEKAVSLIRQLEAALRQKEEAAKIITDAAEDSGLKDMARQELVELELRTAGLQEKVEDLFLEDSEPEGDVIVEIRGAAGGEEAALFAGDLFRMYSRYCEKNGWKLEVLDAHATDMKGFKEVIFAVKGKGAFTHLKFESGVHRVQRVPATEASGRIHTSTITVAVLAEPKEIELKINPEDLRIDTYRASGAGGQHVNRTDSAVRMTHLPTGVVVACQDDRSQIKNREKAMRILKIRLMDKLQKDQTDKLSKERRSQLGTGERSEKIRTYNFSEHRVTDHRIELTVYRLPQILEGDLDEFIKALLRDEKHRVLEAQGLT